MNAPVPDPALSGPEAPVPALTLGERIRLAADGPDVPAHTRSHLALLATDADTLTRVGEKLVAVVKAVREIADQLDAQAAHLKGLGVPVVQTPGARIRAAIDDTLGGAA